MAGHPPPAAPIRLAPHGLVVRESTDFFAVKNPVVAAALAFISANSHRRIGPGDVATAVGVETRTLQNYFRAAIQRPIATEIRRVRIERAKRELAQSNRALDAIARDVGFGNIQRLYEVFRRELGVAPGEYRKARQLRSD
jgi:LacI family transcriptional regulator